MTLFDELKRRNVFRIGAGYVAVSWLIVQVIETLFPVFGLGDDAIRNVVIVCLAGFLPVLAFAWAFELTPEGFKRDEEVQRDTPVMRRITQRLDRGVLVILAVALSYFVFDKFVLAPEREQEIAEEAVEQARDAAVLAAYGDKSIAVLPFVDMSQLGDQQYLGDGIAEELLNLLSRLHDLRVISRSSSFAVRDEGLSSPAIADKLNVAYLLEGSVRKSGDKVRITAQLIEASTDQHLWSQTFDRSFSDIFAIQDEVSRRVVQDLKVQLLGPRFVPGQTDPHAYELYLKGLPLLASRKPEDLQGAIGLFRQAIAIAPDYAPVRGALAEALLWGALDSEAENEAERTMNLDPNNAQALAVKGLLLDNRGKTEEARQLFQRAIETNPSYAMAYRWLGRSYGENDPQKFYAYAHQAHLIDPLDPTIHFQISRASFLLGYYEEAMASAKEVMKRGNPGLAYALAAQVQSRLTGNDSARTLKSFYFLYRESGGDAVAEGLIWMLLELNPELAGEWVQATAHSNVLTGSLQAAAVNHILQRENEVARWIEKLKGERDPWRNFRLGVVYTNILGDYEAAQAAFESHFAVSGWDKDEVISNWRWWPDYCFVLLRNGELEKANALREQILRHLESETPKILEDGWDTRFYIGVLYAMAGDSERAIAALREDEEEGGIACTTCLRVWPHFQEIREDPAFVELVTDAEARVARERRRLENAGLLLTPEEVLAIDDVSNWDPFSLN